MAGRHFPRGDSAAEVGFEHLVIHARADGQGRFTRDDGSPLPTIKPGAAVQLRLAATSLRDRDERRSLSTWEAHELLPERQVLFAIVDARALHEPEHARRLHDRGLLDVLGHAKQAAEHFRQREGGMSDLALNAGLASHEGLLELRLDEPLWVERKGLKTYRLRPCSCFVPALPNPDNNSGRDSSLNHALTRLSEAFELHRISHTGNAFTRFMVLDTSGLLRRLASCRDRVADR